MLPTELELIGVAAVFLTLSICLFLTALAEKGDRRVASAFFALVWFAMYMVIAAVIFGLAYKAAPWGNP